MWQWEPESFESRGKSLSQVEEAGKEIIAEPQTTQESFLVTHLQ